jgi:prevent-host-death family protein
MSLLEEETVDEVVSAAEANRRFSRLLAGVRQGRSYTVTSHGKPIARIVPAGGSDPVREAAKEALLARLRRQPIVHVGKWTREELYEDEE